MDKKCASGTSWKHDNILLSFLVNNKLVILEQPQPVRCSNIPPLGGGGLNKVLHGGAPHRRPDPYHRIYFFGPKRYPFHLPRIKTLHLFSTRIRVVMRKEGDKNLKSFEQLPNLLTSAKITYNIYIARNRFILTCSHFENSYCLAREASSLSQQLHDCVFRSSVVCKVTHSSNRISDEGSFIFFKQVTIHLTALHLQVVYMLQQQVSLR